MLRSIAIATLLCSAAAFAQSSAGSSDSKYHSATAPHPVLGNHPAPQPAPKPRPPPPPPTPAPEQSRREHHPHHHHGQFGGYAGGGYWVPVRVYQTIDEVQLQGPGAIAPLDQPGELDSNLVGRWQLIVPVLTVAEDGYGRVDTVRENGELGELIIQSDGDYEWDVPGRVRSGGSLTEVSAEYGGPGQRFWTFEGNGGTYVAALVDGALLIYDTANNQFFARGTR